MAILNTIQHALTAEQIEQLGVMFPGEKILHLRDINSELFAGLANCPADERLMIGMAEHLAEILDYDMIDQVILPIGSPAFMFCFARTIGQFRKTPFLFAHTERVSEDQPQSDGTIKKVAVFKHVKWLVM